MRPELANDSYKELFKQVLVADDFRVLRGRWHAKCLNRSDFFKSLFLNYLWNTWSCLGWKTTTETLLLYKCSKPKGVADSKALLLIQVLVRISQNTTKELFMFSLITAVSISSISGIFVIKPRSMHILAHIREAKDFFSCMPLGQSLRTRDTQIPATPAAEEYGTVTPKWTQIRLLVQFWPSYIKKKCWKKKSTDKDN